MAANTKSTFTTITTEGGLFPSDFLQRLAARSATIEGVTEDAYHITSGERLNEAISRHWFTCQRTWKRFREKRESLSESDLGTTETRELWLQPLFGQLGYGRLLSARPSEIEGKKYDISHTWQSTPVHLVSYKADLGKRNDKIIGAMRASPHSMVQEFLNRSKGHLWAFVSNGKRLRILRDNVSLVRQAYLEFDLEAMMDGEVYSDFVLLWLLCHQSRVEADRPEHCWLEKWAQSARQEGTRALDKLRDGVKNAIEALGAGFLAQPSNAQLRENLRSNKLPSQEYFRELLRTVYRFLFLFVAEDRNVIHPPDAPSVAREIYAKYYSMARLREFARKHKGTKHEDLWHSMQILFDALSSQGGSPELGLPALGSFLWREDTTPALNDCSLDNRSLLDAIRGLSNIVEDKVVRPIDYKNLGAKEFGSVYESLLELHPQLTLDARSFALEISAGNERKTTGSYYTDDSLVDCLLDSALDPILNDAAKGVNPEQAILDVKVCDPASGSGHFVIAAAQRIAKRLAATRTGEAEPSPESIRTALRDVMGRCIYAVDINPMAVELCKFNLWLEALDPGRPLTFLDHHIKCGNSLLGATPAAMAIGIPDDAFYPIEGDDKAWATALRKKNKIEQKGQTSMLGLFMEEPTTSYSGLSEKMVALDLMPEGDWRAVASKENIYKALTSSQEFERARLVADAWCSAFVWRKESGAPEAVTQEIFRQLQTNAASINLATRAEISRLSEHYRFFHWELAFPEIFRVPAAGEKPENRLAGWNGGFDVLLGNPPWDKVEVLEREWFAARRPDIAEAKTAAARKSLIEGLRIEDETLFTSYKQTVRQVDAQRHFFKNSGCFPLCSKGRANLYAMFAELNRSCMARNGRVGCIVPTGIATDDSTKEFFKDLIQNQQVVSIFDFDNRTGIFPAVQGNERFCLLTLAGGGYPSFEVAAQLNAVDLLKNSDLRYSLSMLDVERINPNTFNAPTFSSARDAELNKSIYSRLPVFEIEGPPRINPWGIELKQGLFNMTSDSKYFRSAEELLAQGFTLVRNYFKSAKAVYSPLYEAKLAFQYDHRAGTFEGTKEVDRFRTHAGTSETTLEQHQDPNYVVTPRYWIENGLVIQQAAEAKWFLAFRDTISAVADARSLVAAIIPACAVGNTLPLLTVGGDATKSALILSHLNSFLADYVLRQKAGGSHLNFFIFRQLPVFHPEISHQRCSWDQRVTVSEFILPRAMELSFTAWDLEPFGRDCGYQGAPFKWDESRRFLIRCELDAALFHLSSIKLQDAEYIMGTFPIVKRRDEEMYGEFKTKRIILEVFADMAEAMRTGVPYKTRLEPPPADPRCCHPPLNNAKKQ